MFLTKSAIVIVVCAIGAAILAMWAGDYWNAVAWLCAAVGWGVSLAPDRERAAAERRAADCLQQQYR